MDVFLDGFNEFLILFGGVRIVHSEVAQAVIFLGCTEVDLQCLGVSYMKVAVRFGRESRMDLLAVNSSAFLELFINDLLYKILAFCHK